MTDAKKQKDKFQNASATQEDLRRDDSSWEQLTSRHKKFYHGILYSQIPYFREKPYIDCDSDSIADYTKNFLAHPGAYGWSLDFNPNFFCELAYEGFLSTGTQISTRDDMLQILLPWIDPQRNSLDFHETHVSHQVRKRAKLYTMTVDTAYDEVLLGCVRQHGEGWLYRGVRWMLRKLHQDGYKGPKQIHVGAHSIELWDSEGRLVAGDLGYTVGGVYTSMTGFRQEHTQGAGEVQLILTAGLLHKMGYKWWDLGMVMDYKAKLGARVISRAAFIERLHKDRDERTQFAHACIKGQELLRHLQAVRADAT